MLKRTIAIAVSVVLVTGVTTVVVPIERAAAQTATKEKSKANSRDVRKRAAAKMQRGMERREGGRQDREHEVAEIL